MAAAAAGRGGDEYDGRRWPAMAVPGAKDAEDLGGRVGRDHLVTWRPAGRAGFLLAVSDGVFFIEEGGADPTPTPPPAPATTTTTTTTTTSVSSIPIAPPPPPYKVTQLPDFFLPSPSHPSKPQHRTLLEATWVRDIDASAGPASTDRVLISDILAHQGGVVAHKPFEQRQGYILGGLLEPLAKDESRSRERDPVKLRKLDFFPLAKLAHLADVYVPQLNHGTEGLRFAARKGRYRVGGESADGVSWMRAADGPMREACKRALEKGA
jgi:hypothetical protein